MKIAIIHDWIVGVRGGEKCLENIHELYPDSDIYTLLFNREAAESIGLDVRRIKSSFIQKLPGAAKHYRKYLLLFPLAVEQFDLSGYDLIISLSHAAAKGVLTNMSQRHICYCFTPMRYAWDLCNQYLSESGLNKGLKGKLAQQILHHMRIWDVVSSNRVDYYVAISNYIARRIKKTYTRDSAVIYPPVDVENFKLYEKKEDYYLTASKMVPYKKIDLIVEAFSRMPDKKLVVIGDGPDDKKIRSKAGGNNIDFLGYQSTDALIYHMQRAKAFVFAAEEDFGILPVEAQACGTPVIAYGKGGARETIVENETGMFFGDQNIESLTEAVNNFEKKGDAFNMAEIRKNAERFSRERFKAEFKKFVEEKMLE